MTKPYASMTEDERWNWHSEVYAFRRVALGASIDEKTSPPDPEGVYFNEELIRVAARRLIDKRNRGRRNRERVRHDELQREGRGLINEWARRKGFADIDAYAAAKRIQLIGGEDCAYQIARREIVAEEIERQRKAEILRLMLDPEDVHSTQSLDDVKTALGLNVKKEFNPTPDDLASARRQLGIEDTPA